MGDKDTEQTKATTRPYWTGLEAKDYYLYYKNHFSPGSGGRGQSGSSAGYCQGTGSSGCGGGGGGVLIDGLGPTGGDATHGHGYGAGGGGLDYEPGHEGVIILDFIRDN